jgi:SlyX protein
MDASLEQRIAELETRLAFQEHALAELSDALAAARSEEARSALLLHRALDELRQLRLAMSSAPVTGDPASEPPPPHY